MSLRSWGLVAAGSLLGASLTAMALDQPAPVVAESEPVEKATGVRVVQANGRLIFCDFQVADASGLIRADCYLPVDIPEGVR